MSNRWLARTPWARQRPALVHVVVAAAVGVVAAVVSAPWLPVALAPLIGWDVAAVTYLALTWTAVGRMDAEQTAQHARSEDPSRPGADLVLLGASTVSLLAVGVVLVGAADLHGAAKLGQILLGTASVVVSWFVVHTTYMLRYATIYLTGQGGVDFKQDDPPRYADFAYLSFTIGMTFQVSDTDLTTSSIRSTALRHALVSYLFGAVVIASAINLIVSLGQ
jgi:uncharacterized membrane protein